MITPDELKKLSLDDIELILQDQQDLYSQDELEEIKAQRNYLLELEQKAREAEKESRRLTVVTCPKCDGPNDPKNTKCIYCDHQFKEQDYYAPKTVSNDTEEPEEIHPADSHYAAGRILLSALSVVMGIVSIFFGNYRNNDAYAQWDFFWEQGQTEPGTPYIVCGTIIVIIGVFQLTLCSFFHLLQNFSPH